MRWALHHGGQVLGTPHWKEVVVALALQLAAVCDFLWWLLPTSLVAGDPLQKVSN